jgi:hypothetical protein
MFRQRFMRSGRDPVYRWIMDKVDAADCATQLARSAVARMNAATGISTEAACYHFTTDAGLRGILQSRELWLTDYRFLADSAEIHDGLLVAKRTFEALRSELASDTYELLRSVLDEPAPQSLFVGCFSVLPNAYHWSEYAGASSGAAIVLEPLGFAPILSVDPFATQFSRVAYTWDAKADLFAELARWMDELIRFDISRDVFDLSVYRKETRQIIGEMLPLCKDVSFHRKHEARLVVAPALSRGDVTSTLTVRSRPSPRGELRFIGTRDVWGEFQLPIIKIILAPEFAGRLDDLANSSPYDFERCAP